MVVIAMSGAYTTHMSIRAEQLPLVSSIHETVELWPKMDTSQKLGACAASLITFAGPLSRIILESTRESGVPPSRAQLFAGIGIDFRDGLDGKVARATEGVTPFGKEFDPLADKIDFLIQEIAQARRGELPVKHVALRFARDALVTGLRAHVMDISNGEANVAASWYGKASTAVRQTSLRLTNSPLEPSSPLFRQAHQTTATGVIIVSGAQNIKSLLDERAKFIPSEDQAA